ncbi:ECF transporter S component [Kocuria palustris]|uniref:ECF transporter S component n=1 Tax=Kocuria palustris TaxID=71999 RepID=UPI00230107C1|nr:ECF transporter S component [Kocuria palustris]
MGLHESLDDVVGDLRRLRSSVGDPSFAQIAQRVTERRIARGTPEAAARVARTTVYDAFRMGRTRLDASLIGEIAAALEDDEHRGAVWARRARRARPHPAPEPPTDSEPQHSALPSEVPTEDDSGAAQSTPPLASDETAERLPAAQTPSPTAPSPQVRRRWVVPIMLVCLAVNLLGYAAVGRLPLPLYLDMVGTAMAALMLGPWRAVVVAVLTHALGMFVGPETSLALMPVNITGALVWGYGAHRWGMTRTPARFLALSLASALACTVVALPLLQIFFDAHTGHTTDGLAADFEARGLPPLGAALTGNLFTSVADKLISGVIALAAVSLLPAARPEQPPTAETTQPGTSHKEYAQQTEGYGR